MGRISVPDPQLEQPARCLRRCRRILHGEGKVVSSLSPCRWGAGNLTGRRIEAKAVRQSRCDRPGKGRDTSRAIQDSTVGVTYFGSW